MGDQPVARGNTRVFTIEDRAGPPNSPVYQGAMVANSPSQSFGEPTRIEKPSGSRYNAWETIGQIPGQRTNPTITLGARYLMDRSDLLFLARKGCPFDIQVHVGKCEDPRDFNFGWEKILVLENARITDWNGNDFGALGSDDEDVVNEDAPTSAEEMYEILPLTFSERGGTQIENEVIDIEVCDAISCGDCEDPSDGCERVFGIQLASGGSPGLLPELIYSSDGASTFADTLIDTLAANEEPTALVCASPNLLVLSSDSCSLHYAPLADILNGVETWTEMTTGFVAANCPRAGHALSPREIWIVGQNGYVYFANDPTALVTVQDAGVATTQDLNAVHAADSDVVVAVGDSNAVIFTVNSGDTWQLVVGPSVGVDLNTVFAKSETEWWIGDAGGQLWYTLDQGTNWTEKAFPGSGAGQVREIKFATDSVGYMAHDTAAPAGRILRTIDGGFSWYVLPEKNGNIPANDRINAIAVCVDGADAANVVYGAGLDDAATDGIVVKASA